MPLGVILLIEADVEAAGSCLLSLFGFWKQIFPQWSWSDFFPADIFPHAHSRSNRCFLCPSHPNIELNFEQYCSCMAAA